MNDGRLLFGKLRLKLIGEVTMKIYKAWLQPIIVMSMELWLQIRIIIEFELNIHTHIHKELLIHFFQKLEKILH